ncbi:DUF3883 domain-containing protein [Chloroflexota bacterium]
MPQIRSALSYKATAADVPPDTELVIAIGEKIGAIEYRQDIIVQTALGQLIREAQGSLAHDSLTPAQIGILGPEILGDPSMGSAVISALRMMTKSEGGDLFCPVSLETASNEQITALKVLQVLGLAMADAEFVRIRAAQYALLGTLVDVGPMPRITEQQLWENLQKRHMRAREAEVWVVNYEQRRLAEQGAPQLAGLVRRVSEFDVGAGFDVQSYEVDGTPRYIEVKSSTRQKIQFFWSLSEMQVAREKSLQYYIYFLPRCQDLPKVIPGLTVIKDPISKWPLYFSGEPEGYFMSLTTPRSQLPQEVFCGVSVAMIMS